MPGFMQELKALLVALTFTLSALVQTIPSRNIEIQGDPFNGNITLQRACSCESWGTPDKEPRQFYRDGSVIWGIDPKNPLATTTDVGACQVRTTVHEAEYTKLGLDVVHFKQDNIAFALLLYKEFGMKPWNSSRKCWQD